MNKPAKFAIIAAATFPVAVALTVATVYATMLLFAGALAIATPATFVQLVSSIGPMSDATYTALAIYGGGASLFMASVFTFDSRR